MGPIASWEAFGGRAQERYARRGPALRLTAAFAAGMLLIGQAFAPASETRSVEDAPPNDLQALASRGDVIGFLPPFERTPNTRRIAWIGGSSLLIKDDQPPPGRPAKKDQKEGGVRQITTLPKMLRSALVGELREPVEIVTYQLNGGRNRDLQLCLLDALAQEPDFLILTVNPIWVLTDKSLATWRNLLPDGTRSIVAEGRGLAWHLATCPPRTLLEGFLRPLWPGLSERFPDARDAADRFSRVLEVTLHGERTKAGRIASRDKRPDPGEVVRYWLRTERRVEALDGPKEVQRAILTEFARPDMETGASAALRDCLETLAERETPALVYLAPFRPDLKRDDVLGPLLRGIGERLREFARILEGLEGDQGFWNPNEEPDIVPKPSKFRDLTHVRVPPQPLVDSIARRVLAAWGTAAQDPNGTNDKKRRRGN